jgi:hypothetical protein
MSSKVEKHSEKSPHNPLQMHGDNKEDRIDPKSYIVSGDRPASQRSSLRIPGVITVSSKYSYTFYSAILFMISSIIDTEDAVASIKVGMSSRDAWAVVSILLCFFGSALWAYDEYQIANTPDPVPPVVAINERNTAP